MIVNDSSSSDLKTGRSGETTAAAITVWGSRAQGLAMRMFVSLLLVAMSLGSAWAGDFGFALDDFERQFKKSQDLVKIDLGLEKVKCEGDTKSRVCTYKTKDGTVVIAGTKGTQTDSIIALFQKPGGKASFEFLKVSAWAIAFGTGVSDPNEYGAQYAKSSDSWVEQLNAKKLDLEITIGNYKWKMFRVSPKHDEMFITVVK